MPDYSIEREVLIEAPVEVVWRTVTEPDQIAQWLADRVELDAEPGGHGVFGCKDGKGATMHTAPLVVDMVEPPTRFSLRWGHPAGDQPTPGNPLLMEFTLVGEGEERMRSRAVESGLELLAWEEVAKIRYAEEIKRLAESAHAVSKAKHASSDDNNEATAGS